MSHRVQRVAELVKRELSMILEKDYSFGGCIATIHEVRPTPDLKQCFVYVGFLGPEDKKAAAMEKLNTERTFIQKALHKRMTMKHSPQLFFRLDTSVEKGVRILNAIDNLPPPADPLPEGEEEPKMK
jgi:ribosome-binding factor A